MSRAACSYGLACVLAALAPVFAATALARNVCEDPKAFATRAAAQPQKSTLMDERVYKRLSAAHERLAQARYDEVLEALRSLESARLSDYERAQVYQTYGFAYAQQERYPEAIEYFEKTLGLDALPEVAQQGMLYSLAGLYAAQQQHYKAVKTMQRWFANAQNPPGEAYMLVAGAYAELDDYTNALPCVIKAIQRATEPHESWYQLLLAIRFEQKSYAAAIPIIRNMLGLWPEELSYWEMLSGAHQQLGESQEALAVLKLAYDKKLLTSPRKLIHLINMHLYLGLPYEAGLLAEREMAVGRIERNERNLRLLLHAWTAAREFERALAVIDALAPQSVDGEYYLQKAQLLAERSDWLRVVEAVDLAVAKGGLAKPGAAYVLKGMALAEMREYREALDTLERARGFDPESRRQADGWIGFVSDRMEMG